MFGKNYETQISKDIEVGLTSISDRMNVISREIADIENDFVLRMVKDQLGEGLTAEKVYAPTRDIN